MKVKIEVEGPGSDKFPPDGWPTEFVSSPVVGDLVYNVLNKEYLKIRKIAHAQKKVKRYWLLSVYQAYLVIFLR